MTLQPLQQKPPKKHKIFVLNILFLGVSAVLLYFLWNAPDETTSFLPKDEIHLEFHAIQSKKEAEKFCLACHDIDKESPLPEKHPPKFRCLFCHKRK